MTSPSPLAICRPLGRGRVALAWKTAKYGLLLPGKRRSRWIGTDRLDAEVTHAVTSPNPPPPSPPPPPSSGLSTPRLAPLHPTRPAGRRPPTADEPPRRRTLGFLEPTPSAADGAQGRRTLTPPTAGRRFHHLRLFRHLGKCAAPRPTYKSLILSFLATSSA